MTNSNNRVSSIEREYYKDVDHEDRRYALPRARARAKVDVQARQRPEVDQSTLKTRHSSVAMARGSSRGRLMSFETLLKAANAIPRTTTKLQGSTRQPTISAGQDKRRRFELREISPPLRVVNAMRL